MKRKARKHEEAGAKKSAAKVYAKNHETTSLIKIIKAADWVTLCNLICGLLSIFFSIRGSFSAAAIIMLVAVLFDFLDGKIARMMDQVNDFGRQLDSLADMVSFGVAPVVLGYSMGLDSFISISVLIFFLCCGALRLARFNIIRADCFIGVPITTNGYIFPIAYLVLGQFTPVFILFYFVMGVLMASSVRIPKVL
jgi:CDP-diacylglycerol---serine O-phosphatidyltransferase